MLFLCFSIIDSRDKKPHLLSCPPKIGSEVKVDDDFPMTSMIIYLMKIVLSGFRDVASFSHGRLLLHFGPKLRQGEPGKSLLRSSSCS